MPPPRGRLSSIAPARGAPRPRSGRGPCPHLPSSSSQSWTSSGMRGSTSSASPSAARWRSSSRRTPLRGYGGWHSCPPAAAGVPCLVTSPHSQRPDPIGVTSPPRWAALTSSGRSPPGRACPGSAGCRLRRSSSRASVTGSFYPAMRSSWRADFRTAACTCCRMPVTWTCSRATAPAPGCWPTSSRAPRWRARRRGGRGLRRARGLGGGRLTAAGA